MSAVLLFASVVVTARTGVRQASDVYTITAMFGTSIAVLVAVMAMHLKYLHVDPERRMELAQRL